MPTFWLNIGLGGAVLAVVGMFLKHMRENAAQCRECRQEQNRLVSNHIQHSTEAMSEVAKAVSELASVQRHFIDKLDGKK